MVKNLEDVKSLLRQISEGEGLSFNAHNEVLEQYREDLIGAIKLMDTVGKEK